MNADRTTLRRLLRRAETLNGKATELHELAEEAGLEATDPRLFALLSDPMVSTLEAMNNLEGALERQPPRHTPERKRS